MRRPEAFSKVGLALILCGSAWLPSRSAFAQDAPPVDLPVAPAQPTEPLPSDPAPAAPPAPAPTPTPTPSVAPEPVPPGPIEPVAPAPGTGSAAFAPLPEPPATAKPQPKSRPAPRTSEAPPKPAAVRSVANVPPPSAPIERPVSGSYPPPPAADSNASDDSDGVFGPFRIGVLVGTGAPDVLSVGGAIKLTRFFGAGINVGIIPTIRLSFYGDAKLSYQEYDAYGRIYPFGGSFFLGAGVGYASIRGMFTTTYDSATVKLPAGVTLPANFPKSVTVESNGSVRTLVLTPQIGFLHTFGSGFTLGIDVGAQVPIAPSDVKFETKESATVPQQLVDQIINPNDAKVRSTLNAIGRTVIPTINLKIGWFL